MDLHLHMHITVLSPLLGDLSRSNDNGHPSLTKLVVPLYLTSFKVYFISLATALSGKSVFILADSLPLSCSLSKIAFLTTFSRYSTKCPQEAHTRSLLLLWSSDSLRQLEQVPSNNCQLTILVCQYDQVPGNLRQTRIVTHIQMHEIQE
jgi:hypothetical protein